MRLFHRAGARVLAKNTNLLKAWGVTSVGLPPQYVSSKDGSFLDSTIDNGYAFDDRYDMALSQNNKYGSLEDPSLMSFVPTTNV